MTLALRMMLILMIPFSAGAAAEIKAPGQQRTLFGIDTTETKLTPSALFLRNKNGSFVLANSQDRYLLSVKFGRLTPKQFQILKNKFGDVSSVTYQQERNYDLIDFLPRYLQATLNSTFAYSFNALHLNTSNEEYDDVNHHLRGGLLRATNCFGFAREATVLLNPALANSQSALFFFEARISADMSLRADEYSRDVTNEPVRPYDVLLAVADVPGEEGGTLLHAAVLIDETILAEKTDSSGRHPYRLAKVADVKAKYLAAPGLKVHFERRRFNEGTKPGLPQPKTGVWGDSSPLERPLENSPAIPYVDHLFNGKEVGFTNDVGDGPQAMSSQLVSILPAHLAIDPKTGRAVIAAPSTARSLLKPLLPADLNIHY
jgi:hypothetical protein